MLNCKDATRLLSASRERRLSAIERVQLAMHLAMCKGCSNFRQQMNFLREASRRHAAGAPLERKDDGRGDAGRGRP